MSAEELENYETDAQLALYREYQDVMSLFSYAIETDRRFYLANKVDVTPQIREGTIYFEVVMMCGCGMFFALIGSSRMFELFRLVT